MSETANCEALTTESVKPVDESDQVKFPPFPDPKDDDFEDDISADEKSFYKDKFPDLNLVKSLRLHCTACDRHLGCAPRNESRMRCHPMLRTLMCNTCHTFYNSGEFEKGEDGSELYCRWCGQGGQVYCCSDCEHVFCAKCIKRNLGVSKIKEIENTDDWKCFKCEPRCLWDLRALCWSLLRFCDLRNKMTYSTQDPQLKEAYQKSLALDESTCCKQKLTKKKVREDSKRASIKVVDVDAIKMENNAAAVISKIPSTIQVKKFASINVDNSPKRAQKRAASPSKLKMAKNCVTQSNKFYTPAPHILSKKMRMMNNSMINPIRIQQATPRLPYMTRPTRPVQQPANQYTGGMPVLLNNTLNNGYNNANSFNSPAGFNNSAGYNNSTSFNNSAGFNNSAVFSNSTSFNNSFSSSNSFNNSPYNSMLTSDNINLSLEELTQGLDMAAVVAMASNNPQPNNDVVCTPDFPLEPLCEVTEEHNEDDDVECISGPKVSKPNPNPSPCSHLTPRLANAIPDLSPENIVQMTDNDVTVNPQTGGLKFRVDPQTLSSNKMYRLPDGRIFAINSNPNMPGGYSATIVAVSENNKKQKAQTKGATYAARLSTVAPPPTPPAQSKSRRPAVLRPAAPAAAASTKPRRSSSRVRRQSVDDEYDSNIGNRETDLKVPIEWYRYNLIDAVDSLVYSLMRLKKLRKEATTTFLRTRTVNEMRTLHRDLERVLNTSCKRFQEIKLNLDDGLKSYIANKSGDGTTISDDDDSVEILENERNDDPIFIDENSVDSVQEQSKKPLQVDLTEQSFGELNDSSEKSVDQTNNIDKDPFYDVNGQDKEELSNEEKSTNEEKGNDDIVDSGKPSEDKTNDILDDSKKQSGDEDNGDVDMVDTILGGHADSVLDSEQVNKESSESEEKAESKDEEEVDTAVEKHTETANDDKQDDTNKGDDEKLDDESEEAVISETVNENVNNEHNKETENESIEEENKTEDTVVNSSDENSQEPEMTEDMIDDLLNDNLGDDAVTDNLNLLDIPDLQEP